MPYSCFWHSTTRSSNSSHLSTGKSHAEMRQKLAVYGINPDEIPVSDTGEITRLDAHLEFIRKRIVIEDAHALEEQRRKEAAHLADEVRLKTMLGHNDEGSMDGADSLLIAEPSTQDVLLGRGKRSRLHPGNMRLRLILEDRLDEYNSTKQKQPIVASILQQLTESKVRFLEPVPGGVWKVVPAEKMTKKISHDFRTLRGAKKERKSSNEASKRLRES